MMRRKPFLSLVSVNFTDGAVSAESETAAVSAPSAATRPAAYRRTRIRVIGSSCLSSCSRRSRAKAEAGDYSPQIGRPYVILNRRFKRRPGLAGRLVGGRRFERPDNGRRGRSRGRTERLPRTRDESAGVGDREADA